ncbi:hypothetical protein EYF80_046806 [Liparis tanakae]|uniref:Uncharacterized protein n=1 Tax=Liparis tanakae TaxID=230148 RepID=A0A4Z2FPE8_9TELE|nr:hypothetical protein EYF80_046806 [Liparis tanakae]
METEVGPQSSRGGRGLQPVIEDPIEPPLEPRERDTGRKGGSGGGSGARAGPRWATDMIPDTPATPDVVPETQLSGSCPMETRSSLESLFGGGGGYATQGPAGGYDPAGSGPGGAYLRTSGGSGGGQILAVREGQKIRGEDMGPCANQLPPVQANPAAPVFQKASWLIS